MRWPSAATIPDDPTSIAITGYRLYMDGGNDGKFQLIFDGQNLPGVLQHRVTSGILAGRVYRFKVSALNFNGEGDASTEELIYACLSPSNFSAPTYASSTETSLTIEWGAPRVVNGCPITKYQLFRDTGANDDISVQVGVDLEPHITTYEIALDAGDTSKTFRVQLVVFNDAGSVQSGVGSFVLADVPNAPDPPINDADVTSDSVIRVNYAETLPDSRGSPIIGLQLAMDDGLGGEFVIVVGEDESVTTLETSYVVNQGIIKGRAYRFRCRVLNSIGWSGWSSPDTYIVAAVTPAKPRAPALISATSTEMDLELWIPEDNGGSPLTQFELYINDGDDTNEPDARVETYTSNDLTHTLTVAADSLTPGLIYKLQFRATNAIGNSELSDTSRFALADAPNAPSAPTNMPSQTSTS